MRCMSANDHDNSVCVRDFGGFSHYAFYAYAFYFTCFTGVKSNTHALIRR